MVEPVYFSSLNFISVVKLVKNLKTTIFSFLSLTVTDSSVGHGMFYLLSFQKFLFVNYSRICTVSFSYIHLMSIWFCSLKVVVLHFHSFVIIVASPRWRIVCLFVQVVIGDRGTGADSTESANKGGVSRWPRHQNPDESTKRREEERVSGRLR